MGKLTYITNVSLDGYIEDADGGFDFSQPSDEYLTFITDLVRPLGTWLYGRRLYESMAVWETDPTLATRSELTAEFAKVWQAGDKIVYSTTLDDVATARTRIEPSFDPDAVREIKSSSVLDLTIGGAELAAHAFNAGLIDEVHFFVSPALLGSGKPAFSGDSHVQLDLLEQRQFDVGSIYLRYGVR